MNRLAEFGVFSLVGLGVGGLVGNAVTDHTEDGDTVVAEVYAEGYSQEVEDGVSRTDDGTIYVFVAVGLLAGALPGIKKHIFNINRELREGYDPDLPTFADIKRARWEAQARPEDTQQATENSF